MNVDIQKLYDLTGNEVGSKLIAVIEDEKLDRDRKNFYEEKLKAYVTDILYRGHSMTIYQDVHYDFASIVVFIHAVGNITTNRVVITF